MGKKETSPEVGEVFLSFARLVNGLVRYVSYHVERVFDKEIPPENIEHLRKLVQNTQWIDKNILLTEELSEKMGGFDDYNGMDRNLVPLSFLCELHGIIDKIITNLNSEDQVALFLFVWQLFFKDWQSPMYRCLHDYEEVDGSAIFKDNQFEKLNFWEYKDLINSLGIQYGLLCDLLARITTYAPQGNISYTHSDYSAYKILCQKILVICLRLKQIRRRMDFLASRVMNQESIK